MDTELDKNIVGLGGVIPVPGLSVGIDSALTFLMVKDQREVLGLTDEHLEEHAKHLGISRQEYSWIL